MKRLFSALLAVCLAFNNLAMIHGGSPSIITDGTDIDLSVSAFGIFDPSIADTPAATRAYMSYSAIDASPTFPINNRVVTTRVAYTDDAGATWHDDGLVNDISEAVRSGHDFTWINEVSTLIYDAAAPSGERWKLFWHHYPVIDGVLQGASGWIALKKAATPEGLTAATEEKIFAGSAYDTNNNTAGGSTASPLGGAPLVPLTGLSLSYCLVVTEPGGLANATAVYLALNCLQSAPPPNPPSRILTETDILACAQPCTPDDPAAWALAGVPLTLLDDLYFGTLRLSGQDIFFDGNTAYLMVSPVGSSPVAGAYQGIMVFQFTNLATGAILRDGSGHPRIVNQVQGTYGTYNGAGTFAQNVTAAGYTWGEIPTFIPSPIFVIKKAGRR